MGERLRKIGEKLGRIVTKARPRSKSKKNFTIVGKKWNVKK